MFIWHVYFFVTTGFCVTRCGQTSHRTTRRKSRRTSRRNRRRNGSVFERICHRGQSKRSGTSRMKGAAKILVFGTTSLWARGLREDRLTPPAPLHSEFYFVFWDDYVKTNAFLGYCMSHKVARAPASGAEKRATKRKSTATQKKDEKPTMSATHNARWDFVARNHLGAVFYFFCQTWCAFDVKGLGITSWKSSRKGSKVHEHRGQQKEYEGS